MNSLGSSIGFGTGAVPLGLDITVLIVACRAQPRSISFSCTHGSSLASFLQASGKIQVYDPHLCTGSLVMVERDQGVRNRPATFSSVVASSSTTAHRVFSRNKPS